MQFIEGGPHIPDKLIEQLEDGNVALFAGAGVSKNIGLPLFDELVKQVYEHLAQPMRPEEQEEFNSHNYDRVLGLLETRFGGGSKVREAVRTKLTIPRNQQLPLHTAVLQLARTRDGAYRLVTTNFDRGFVMTDPSVTFETAPAVPVPRRSRWYRPVHLHGLIEAEGRTLNDLVLTSADFGDAYITSGWASRFVSELFARFSVLFIGYSVSDPVMRYLVDAMAVSRSRGEHSHSVYALVPAGLGEDQTVHRSWEAKGVNAIPYERDRTHSRLERTLIEWAEIHKSGQAGRLSVIAQFADDPPSQGEQDHRSSQMIWALSDESGQAAKKFASLNPPIGWLSLLEQNRLMDLPMAVGRGPDWLGLHLQPVNPRSGSLHKWLLGHLDKTEIIERAIKRNSILEYSFRWELHRKLWYFKELVPEPYRRFWELLGSTSAMDAVVELPHKAAELVGRLKDGKCDPLLFIEATDQLRPIAVLSRPTLRRLLRGEDTPPKEVSDLAEFDLKLVADVYTHEIIDGLKACCAANSALLPAALLGATTYLERSLKLFAAAGSASVDFDPSIFQMQSLRENSAIELHSWTALIALARDLLSLARHDRALARAFVTIWLSIPYPVFLRMALFGMYDSDAFEPSEGCRLLLQLSARQFWHYTNDEFIVPLVAKLWPRVEQPEATQLIDMILAGPPRDLFPQDLSEEEFLNRADRMRFRFLVAIESTEQALPQAAAAKMTSLRSAKAGPLPEESCSDAVAGESGFRPRVSESEVNDYNRFTTPEIVNDINGSSQEDLHKLDLLLEWARRYPGRAVDLLDALVVAKITNIHALAAIVGGLSVLETIPERIITIIPKLSKEMRGRVASTLLSWMARTSRDEPVNSEFLAAWDSLAEVAVVSPMADGGKFFRTAFGSPIGQMTVMLLNRWLATAPKRASGLLPEIRDRLVALLGKPDETSRVARAMIAGYLYSLHFVDRPWTLSTLVPLFDWRNGTALETWQGYLFNAHWYPDLLADLKPSLITAFRKGNQLGEAANGLWRLLAAVAAFSPSSLSDKELGDSLQSLDKGALAFVASSFGQILKRAEPSERPKLWERGILRALKLWPLDKQLRSEDLSESLVTIAVLEEEIFEQVASCIEHLLEPIKHTQMVLHQFCRTQLPEKHPTKVARLLSLIIDPHGQQPYVDTQAHQLLQRLKAVEPRVALTPEFEKLAKTGWFEI